MIKEIYHIARTIVIFPSAFYWNLVTFPSTYLKMFKSFSRYPSDILFTQRVFTRAWFHFWNF